MNDETHTNSVYNADPSNKDATNLASVYLGSNNPLSRSSIRVGRRAFAVSFCMISILGATAIYFGWKSIALSTAIERCVGFIVIMAGVHFLGYRLWLRQPAIISPVQSSPARLQIFWFCMSLVHGAIGFLVASFLMYSHLCDRSAPWFEIPFIIAVSMACFLCVFQARRYRSALKGMGLILLISIIIAFVYLTILHL